MKTTNVARRDNTENFETIVREGCQIDTDKVANEILDWVIANVEQFIDNQTRTFKLDLIIDGESVPPMPETTRLQNLYRHIPQDEDLINAKDVFRDDGTINMKKMNTKSVNQAAKVRVSLNDVVQECFKKMQANEQKLKMLYDRMSFFYEMTGFYKGAPLLREISGAVNIVKFEYEAFCMDVKVQSPTYKIQREDGSVDTVESETKEYTVPEGFTVWVEISFRDVSRAASLF